MTSAKKISYLLFAAMAVMAVALRLGPVIIAGLFSFMILELTNRALSLKMPRLTARWLSLLIFTVVAAALMLMLAHFFRQAFSKLPSILGTALQKTDSLGARYGFNLPFDSLQESHALIMETIKGNFQSITKASGLLTKEFFRVFIGVFIAVLCFLSDVPRAFQPNLFDAVRGEFNARLRFFMSGFEKILGAQFIISTINTLLTACFLLIMGLPYLWFLTLSTFILGMLPLIGNVLSNTIVVGAALMLSPHLAFVSLGYLILIHRILYLLYNHLVGADIKTPMWQILLGVLIGEAVMGIPGIILAPAVLHCIQGEMRAIKYQPA